MTDTTIEKKKIKQSIQQWEKRKKETKTKTITVHCTCIYPLMALHKGQKRKNVCEVHDILEYITG